MSPKQRAIEISINITETKICMLLNVTFLSIILPISAPIIADTVAEMSKVKFSDKPEAVKREAYTDSLVRSTSDAMITPVAIYASLDKPLFIKNALLKAP